MTIFRILRHWCPVVEKVKPCNSFYKCCLQGYCGVIDLKSNLPVALNDKYIYQGKGGTC